LALVGVVALGYGDTAVAEHAVALMFVHLWG
jgi:hypothetical protein